MLLRMVRGVRSGAGTTEAIFSARKATYAHGLADKQCMTARRFDIEVRKSNGARLC